MGATKESAIVLLTALLDQGYDRRSWHGTNLRGSLRGLPAETAEWRPGPGRHNIWEIAVHAAYWKYAVCRRLTGAKRGVFPLKGSNWFPRPLDLSEAAWRADLALLEEMHRSLRHAVADLDESAVHFTPRGSKVSNFALISGVAAHDIYHAGQIQLLKRLAREAAAGDGEPNRTLKGRKR
jgi:uncharacterized damage-inducible protein DinB